LFKSLEAVIGDADFLVLCCPLNGGDARADESCAAFLMKRSPF